MSSQRAELALHLPDPGDLPEAGKPKGQLQRMNDFITHRVRLNAPHNAMFAE